MIDGPVDGIGDSSLKAKYRLRELRFESVWSCQPEAVQFIAAMPTGQSRNSSRRLVSICTSISGRTCFELAEKARHAFAQGTDLVEFRIDALRSPTFEKIEANLSEFCELAVLTVRPAVEGGGFTGKESDRLVLIHELAELRPAFFDVGLQTLEANPDLAAEALGRTRIVSWHDQVKTPSRARLLSIMRRAAAFGTPKVVTTANAAKDNLAILSLYDESGSPPIAFCMGDRGIFSRVMAMERGSPIAYASLLGEPIAPGQFTLSQALATRRRLESA